MCLTGSSFLKSSQSAVSSPVDVPLHPGSRPRRLVAISHQPPTLVTAAGPRYITSAQTAQKTPLPILLLLHAAVAAIT
jgi:hypothetical protein